MRAIDADKLLRDIEKYHVSDGKFQHWVEIQPTIKPECGPMKCPWQSTINASGPSKETTFGKCLYELCPFFKNRQIYKNEEWVTVGYCGRAEHCQKGT